MAIGTGLAMLAGSAVSGIASASGAKKAAKAQTAAADQATRLQRDIYNQTSENYQPYLSAGNDAMAAYLYEMGLGPRPTFGGTAPTIETIRGTPGTPANTSNSSGSVWNPDVMKSILGTGGRTGGTADTYRVGGQTFSTLAEAEEWASKNKTGGTEYQGYQQSPMAKYLMEEGVDSITGSNAAAGNLFSGASMQALENNRQQVIGADTADYFSKLFGMSNMGMSAAGNQASAGGAYANNVGNLAMQAANAKGQGYMASANAMSGFINDAAGIAGYYGWGQNTPQSAYASPTMETRPKPNPYY